MDEYIIDRLDNEDKKIASLTRRMIAYFIDNLICSILIALVFAFTSSDEKINSIRMALNEKDALVLNEVFLNIFLFYCVVKFAYLFLFFYLYGATFGNMVSKTRIINYQHFDSPDFINSLIRAIVFMLCDVFMNGVLFLSVFLNKTRRHFADMASKSVVIKVD